MVCLQLGRPCRHVQQEQQPCRECWDLSASVGSMDCPPHACPGAVRVHGHAHAFSWACAYKQGSMRM